MHKGYRPGSHSAKRHEDPHVVVSTHLSDGGSIKAMHAAISADSVLIARWAGGCDPHAQLEGRLRDARANARPLGTCTQAGKGITQGDSSAHALLALTPSHRTSPANKHKPKKDSLVRSHDEV